MSKKATPDPRRPVLILDTHRGIYFGYLVDEQNAGRTVVVENARHCFTYGVHPGHEGTYGLASGGPVKGSRIGPRWSGKIHDVSKVIDCTPAAVERWESSEWGK